MELVRLLGTGRKDFPIEMPHVMTACGVTSEEQVLVCLDCLLAFKTPYEVPIYVHFTRRTGSP